MTGKPLTAERPPDGLVTLPRRAFGALAALGLLSLSSIVLTVPHAAREGPSGPSFASSPPLTLLLQPDGANGTDTSLLDAFPAWNFGTNGTLFVGRGPDGVGRSLLGFDLSAVPVSATILNASLGLYQTGGGLGPVEVRRASAPWLEGDGGRSWTSVPVAVRETAGVRRTREPVAIPLTFPPNSIGDPARDLRVFLAGMEVPSQVRSYTYVGGRLTGATVAFEATVPPGGTQSFTIRYGANGTGVPAYRTKTWGATPLWTSPPVGSGASGITVVDLYGDGNLEVVYGTATGYVFVLNGDGTVRWSTLVSGNSVPYAPQVADIDRDGRLDILVLTNDPSLVRLNDTGGVVWTAPMSVPDLPVSTPTLWDVDGDGVQDVLLGRKTKKVEAFDGTTGAIIQNYGAGDWAFTPSIADANRDGVAELYFGSDDALVHAYAIGGARIWEASPPGTSFIENSVAIGDVDGDGMLDVVTGDDLNVGLQFALNATNGAVLWSIGLPNYREGGQTLADLDGDGSLEVVVGLYNGVVYGLRGRDGSTLWTYPAGTTQAVAPAVVDLTNDGRPEIVYLDKGTVVRVLNATGALVHAWNITANDPGLRTLAQRPMATPVAADLDGDGTLEVVVPTGSGVQAFATGGLAADWRTYGYNWNHTHRAGDGASPSGAPFLHVSLGAPTVYPASGASWGYRDGVVPWASAGGDFGGPEGIASAAAGWVLWNVTGMVLDWYVGTYPNVGLVLTAADEAAGADHGFASSDSGNATSRPRLEITYTVPVADPVPRILGAIPDQSQTEDAAPWTLDLTGLAADDDTPLAELRWNLTGWDPGVLQVSGLNDPGNRILTFAPRRDASGTSLVTYWLTDPEGHASSRRAWINVTPVNDPPSFAPPSSFVVHFNKTYAFDFGPYIADVDTPRVSLALFSDDPAHATVSGFNVSFLYPASYLDRWAFVGLTVGDGAAVTARVVAVKVTSDDPPELKQWLPDVQLLEGETRVGVFDLDSYFTDPNNDVLFFSYGYSHLNITIHGNHSVDVAAQSDWNGVEEVTFRGTDALGAIAEDAILVRVLPVDDPPVLGPVPDLVVHHDANYTFNLDPYIADPDTPIGGINASTSSPYVTLSGHLMILLYPGALNGTVQDLAIWIGDGTSVASRTVRVTVSDDWPPVLRASLPPSTFLEDTVLTAAYDLSAFFDDPDGPALYYSSGNLNVQVSIDATGVVDLRALADWYGMEQITFRATDPAGALAEDTVVVTVLPVDDAPVFRAIPTVYLNGLAGFLDLTPYLSDVDTNLSDLVLVASSANVTVVGQALLFNYSGPGQETVEVVASDGLLTGRASVTIVVAVAGGTEVIPGYLVWIPVAVGAAAFGAFIVYRRRQIEWAFLVTNGGLLISSVSRKDPTVLDTDLMMGMLTAILDFVKHSFSDETERGLEELDLGDSRVEIERGTFGYLAIVYRGRTSGLLPRHMRRLLAFLEGRFPQAFGDIVDPATVQDIPTHLKRFIDRSWWPLLRFPDASARTP